MNAMREGPLQFSVPECEGRKVSFKTALKSKLKISIYKFKFL